MLQALEARTALAASPRRGVRPSTEYSYLFQLSLAVTDVTLYRVAHHVCYSEHHGICDWPTLEQVKSAKIQNDPQNGLAPTVYYFVAEIPSNFRPGTKTPSGHAATRCMRLRLVISSKWCITLASSTASVEQRSSGANRILLRQFHPAVGLVGSTPRFFFASGDADVQRFHSQIAIAPAEGNCIVSVSADQI